jgi:hypothetical protein
MPKYPDVLTNKQWQKNKGLLAKSKPTGIGEKLIALEKLYQSSFFVKADAKAMGGETVDIAVFEKKLGVLLKTLGAQATKIDAAAADADKTIRAAMPTFAKDKAISRYLETLTLGLKGLRADIKADGSATHEVRDAVVAAFVANLKKTKTYAYIVTNKIADIAEKKRMTALGAVKKLEAKPQVATVHALWSGDGPHRSMPTNCKMWDQIFAVEMPQTTDAIYAGKTMQTYARMPWISEVANETNQDATNVVRADAERTSEERAVKTMALEYSRALIEFAQFNGHLRDLAARFKKYA